MMIKNGPAFPVSIANHGTTSVIGFDGDPIRSGQEMIYAGLTIRDYFAAKAMASLTPVYWEDFESYGSGAELNKCLCETAYEMADAMLAERAK